jgi:potassium-transporting ATPase KdpC subunit
MRRTLTIACLDTVVTTVIFGLFYPLIVTGFAQLLFRNKANGQLITRDGK